MSSEPSEPTPTAVVDSSNAESNSQPENSPRPTSSPESADVAESSAVPETSTVAPSSTSRERCPTPANSAARQQDFACPLCLKLLFKPVTTSCGHSFCQDCLRQLHDAAIRAQSHTQCPLCRASLPVVYDAAELKVSVTLEQILETSFSAAYAKRRAAATEQVSIKSGSILGTVSTKQLPIFVLDSMLPGQTMTLNVFEPRYLAMVRNALRTTGRSFGMVGADPQRMGAPYDHGVEVRIEEQREGPNARIPRLIVKVRALQAFRVLQHRNDPSGFMVGLVEMLSDDCLPFTAAGAQMDGESANSLQVAAARVREKFHTWKHFLVEGGYEWSRDGQQVMKLLTVVSMWHVLTCIML